LQVHICKFAHLQVCKFTKLKNLEHCNLIITILQHYKLQVYKITKSRNYKLQLKKLQVWICKVMQVCKFLNLQIYKI
jgi:hypothetical protein